MQENDKTPQKIDQTIPQGEEHLQTILDRIGKKIKAEAGSPTEGPDKLFSYIQTAPSQKTQQCLSFIPTPMARTSPFFPMSDRDKKHRPHETIAWETSWGKIEVSGPRLSIFDEDVLLAILALLKLSQRKQETSTDDGQRTYTVRTSGYTICKYLRTPASNKTYSSIEGAIERMTSTKVKIVKVMNVKIQ